MTQDLVGCSLPDGLIATGSSPVFKRGTLPAALQQEHSLAEGFWAVLHVLAGSVRFEDLQTGEIRRISAPGRQVICPLAPHRLIVDGEFRCRIDFFKSPITEPG